MKKLIHRKVFLIIAADEWDLVNLADKMENAKDYKDLI